MFVKYDNSLIEEFTRKPRKIYLFGTEGVIKLYIAYIKLLSKYNIRPTAVVSRDKEKIGSKVLDVPIISNQQFEKEVCHKEVYILLSSSAERYKKRDLSIVRGGGYENVVIYYDFPFQLGKLDYPYMRCWSENNSWFYDVLYAGLKVYDENPKRYIEGVYEHNGLTIKNGIFMMENYQSEFVNINNNRRKTINQPIEYEKNVYICGSCIAYGDRCDDSTTIASQLQKLLNRYFPKQYCVNNCAAVLVTINNLLRLVQSLNLKQGDIVLFVDMPRILISPESVEKYTKKDIVYIYYDILKEIQSYCEKRGAKFYFFSLPSIQDIEKKSNFEKEIEKNMATTIAKERKYFRECLEAGKKIEPLPNIKKDNSRISFDKVVLADSKLLFEVCSFESKVPSINLVNYFNRNHEYVEIYSDNWHLAYMGYAYVARIIFNVVFDSMSLKTTLKICQENRRFFENLIDRYVLTDELKIYIENLRKISSTKSDDAGIIVMNCNPFTKGHRYLIEKAAGQVEQLYVLVVEEDKSVFKFSDRFQMVKDGTSDLKNVEILKSGKFVISSLTFPEYFTKDTKKNSDFDASTDLFNFCRYIAPALKAKKRFVGEEPFDIVTNAYNDQMREFLPANGIDLIVVPRKESDGIAISATRGRMFIKNKDWKGIEEIFPESTIKYLKKNKMI